MEFENEPGLDLTDIRIRKALTSQLAELDARLPLRVGSLVGSDRSHGASIRSVDPSAPGREVALADNAAAQVIDAAVELAGRGARDWAAVSPAERVEILCAAIDGLRSRRKELAALMVREAAKPWDEADGEVSEAIDFIRCYTTAIEVLPAALGPASGAGEHNSLRLIPRGVTAVVAPWNFPVAIPLGMTVGALAGGNSVILKPAEQTPACGDLVVRVLRDAGVPAEALTLLQGRGSVGAALVRHPGVATIAFTGSSEVGRSIASAAARVAPEQRQLKRLIAEMGGKNCAIVAPGADLDATAEHIARSAFSYAGQKCSALSRVLVHHTLANDLTDRLAGALERLPLGPPADFHTVVPPLIDEDAKARLEQAAADAESTGTILAHPSIPEADGHYVAPTLVGNLPPGSPLLQEELFGPLLTVEHFDALDDAANRVDRLPLALVGGIYTHEHDLVEQLVRRSPVGNLYVNRPTVGALVGRQPFGGGRLSGTGHKAGSMHYVAAFCEQQLVSERTPD